MKIILFIFLLVISFNSFSQNLDCAKFKYGKFTSTVAEAGVSYKITRKGNTQIEYGEHDKLKIKFRIDWLDECTYTLQVEKILKNPKKIQFDASMILKVQIIEVKEHSYVARSTSDQFDFTLVNEITEIGY